MSEYVRVRDLTTGHEYTTRERNVVEGLEVLDKPALGADGLPRPPKYRVPLGEPHAPSTVRDNPAKPVNQAAKAATTKTATSAGSEKEN